MIKVVNVTGYVQDEKERDGLLKKFGGKNENGSQMDQLGPMVPSKTTFSGPQKE
jgi:hypothetical protein